MKRPYRIQLVACAIEQSPLAYPLGALSILTALRTEEALKDTIEVGLSHFIGDTDHPRRAAKEIAAMHCDLIGISLYLYNRPWFDQFLEAFQLEKSPHTKIYAGGPEAGAHPTQLLDSGLDFLILGEGEETVVEAVSLLLKGEEPQGRGITTKKVAHGPSHPKDLALLASPLLTGIADPSEYDGVLWEMTRGCPYQCTFCFESRGNRSVRNYPMDRIEQELQLLISHAVKHVFVLDPTFNMNKKLTIERLTLLCDHAPPDMHITFEVRAELLTPQMVQLFAQLYCSLQIGLQSSNQKVLNHIGRDFNAKLFSKNIALLNEEGVVFGLDLIIGLPSDTLSSYKESLDYALSCKPSNLDIFLLALLPGTQLAQDAPKLGLVHQTESPYLLLESPSMNAEDIAEALVLKEACDQFYTRGQAVMWFHAACNGVGMRPVELLEAFIRYTTTHPVFEDEEIFETQDAFITHLYQQQGCVSLLPALLSYMELHQGIIHFQETGESPVVNLHYDADDLALLDRMSLAEFTKNYKASSASRPYGIFMHEGIIYVEEIASYL